jgi:plasmid stabilization system protein ParE
VLPVKVTARAAGEIQKAGEWWVANRDKAPRAFREEIERGFGLLSQQPEVGARAANTKLQGVRRIHLSRIRYFLYYRILPAQVEVLALWHSSRSKGLGL